MSRLKPLGAAALLAGAAMACSAQTSSVTVYGVIDQYLNYMRSGSGATVKSLEDGAWLRSRLGFRGVEDLGGGYAAKFQMEGGFSTDTGAQGDANRFFDRQTWVGLASPFGEVRFGRQNGPIQSRGAYVDFTARDLGSMINNFGVPSRYDNDFAYISPRASYGLQFEGHVNLPETSIGDHPMVYQGSLDWTNDTFRAGYMGMRGRPPKNAAINRDVVYDNYYGNWMYGKGTVYLAFLRSNNITKIPSGTGAGITTGAQILSNTGGNASAGALFNSAYNTGANPDLNNFYNIWQISADYRVLDTLRVGALWGRIQDKSGRDQGASGGSVGAFYDLSKRTMLLFLVDTIRNDTNGGWRPAGSAGLKTTFTNPLDVNGKTINGVQAGIVHRF